MQSAPGTWLIMLIDSTWSNLYNIGVKRVTTSRLNICHRISTWSCFVFLWLYIKGLLGLTHILQGYFTVILVPLWLMVTNAALDYIYASACKCWRYYVFGLSVRPSVRSLKCPLSTCTWVRWSIRLSVTVFQHVRLSDRPERFLGISWGMAWKFTCWCILTTFRTY